jgi:hypothetical protein
LPTYGTSTITSQTRVLGSDSQAISLRPGAPGTIYIHSAPSPYTARTETGLLAVINLRRPGSPTAVATAKFKGPNPSLSLSYNATAADVAIPGDWTCEVVNASLDPITFATDVTVPIANPLLTATMDVGFINLVLAKVADAAAITIHLESSDNGRALSNVRVAPDIASLVNIATIASFNVADQSKSAVGISFVYRIVNLDSHPDYPIVVLQLSPPGLKVVIRFKTDGARLVAQNLPAPDIVLRALSIEIDVGFDGSIRPVCTAIAKLTFNNIDFSQDVITGVQDAITGQLRSNPGFAALLDPQQVRVLIDRLFIAMMRLGPQAQIQNYAIDGQTLIVSYFEKTA